jgi:hypothetical protein
MFFSLDIKSWTVAVFRQEILAVVGVALIDLTHQNILKFEYLMLPTGLT